MSTTMYAMRAGQRPLLIGRLSHTVYSSQYVVATGDLMKGFTFYGPFDTEERADTWAKKNIKPNTLYDVYPLCNVRDGDG